MKVTYNWLKDFVEIKISPEALADKLTMAGLEVISLKEAEGDFVFELEVTSNRADCLSVIGIAREVAAITGKKLASAPVSQLASLNRQTGRPADRLTINIQNKKDCPLYTAKIIRNVKAEPSQGWLKKRLESIGCRSVNNIVDITNYVMFEWGEPLHAFDLDKIVSQLTGYPVSQLNIIIRRAKNGEELTTIDDTKRILNDDILVIASGIEKVTGKPANRQTGKPIAIAGIMGGQDTEVTESTKNILLEAAVFNPIIVRRGRQTLGIASESAYRFERGIDLNMVENASLRALELIQDFAGGKCVLQKSSTLPKTKSKSINLEASTVHKILGVNIATPKIKKILNSLDFKTKTKPRNSFEVRIPSHRPDVNLEIDLIEEIARIFGFEFIPKNLPAVKPGVSVSQIRGLVSLVKNILVGLGLNEVITYSLIDRDLLRNFRAAQMTDAIEILNPLSREQEILRPSVSPSLATCVAYNLSQKQEYVNIFEVAKSFLGSTLSVKEELVLGIALSGERTFLLEQGLIKEKFGFLHLKGILETIFERLGIKDYNFNPEDEPFAVTIYVKQEKIGLMARLQKSILDKLNIKDKDVLVAELSLDKVFSYAKRQKKFLPPPKYPAIVRDISFILKDDISIKEILEAIEEKGRPLLSNVKVTDYYRGKQIPPGYRGITISCLYRSDARTLTEVEINPLHTLICSILTEKFEAKIR